MEKPVVSSVRGTSEFERILIPDGSEIISMNQEDAKQFEEFVSSVSLEYPYSELYGVNECYDRIFTYSSVSKHERSALDNNGKLTMINYLQSVNLSTFLNSDIPAYYAETISFYNDPDKLLHIFHASSKEEITEVASLMEAIQIIQYLPDEFQTAYKDKYGIDLSASEEQDKLRYSLKPAVCLTFSKTFYKNLAIALTEGNDITENDLFYLIRIFEAAMDYHSTYTKQERLEINKPFLDRYKEIRTAFFLLLKENGMEIDENAYLTYEMFTEEDPTVANASFRWLVQGKREFLLERTEFLKDQLDSKIA